MFQIPEFTYVTLTNLNTRIEKHGDESVSAIDLTISYDAPNAILDSFEPGLLDAMYAAADGAPETQATMDGFEISSQPLLRFKRLGPLKLETKYVGHRFVIDYGLGDDRALVLQTCESGKFVLELKEGGTVSMKFRVQTNSGLTEQIIGKLAMLISQEVRITLTPPEVASSDKEPGLILPVMEGADKPLTAEEVFITSSVPGEAAAVH